MSKKSLFQKGVGKVLDHLYEMRQNPTKFVANLKSPSTVTGTGLGLATWFGGGEIHALIGPIQGASTEELVAHGFVFVAQAVLGLISLWAVGKRPGDRIDD